MLALIPGTAAAQVTCQTANGITRCHNPQQPQHALTCQSAYGITRCNNPQQPQQAVTCQTANGITHCNGILQQPNQPERFYSPPKAHVQPYEVGLQQRPYVDLSTPQQRNSTSTENGPSPAPSLTRRQSPNDVELKASYCIGVLKAQREQLLPVLASLEKPPAYEAQQGVVATMREHMNELDSNLKRLVSFLQARMRYLRPSIVIAATQQGEEDWARQTKSSTDKTCTTSCRIGANTQDWLSKAIDEYKKVDKAKCYEDCMEGDDLSKRIFSCNKLSFLPY